MFSLISVTSKRVDREGIKGRGRDGRRKRALRSEKTALRRRS